MSELPVFDLENPIVVDDSPIVSVIVDGLPHDFHWSEIRQDDDDLATISDDTLKSRAEIRMENVEIGALDDYIVQRPDTGHVLIRRKAVYGDWSDDSDWFEIRLIGFVTGTALAALITIVVIAFVSAVR